MAAVANGSQHPQHHHAHPAQQQAIPPTNSRNSPASLEHSRDASVATTSDGSLAAPPPPPVGAASNNHGKPAKGKGGRKAPANHNDPTDAHKALLSKISQLEATTHEDAHQSAEIDAEVKKANRDLSQLLNTLEPEKGKLDLLQKKYSDLFAEMKRVEREHTKAKKRGDQLQKEKEEISKERGRERSMKEKLEKLSRELTRENKKLKDDFRDLKENSAHRNDELHQRLESLVADVEGVVAPRGSPRHPDNNHYNPHHQPLSTTGADSPHPPEVEHDRMFREKFTSFLLQYELRELHFQSQMRVKELELAQQIARHEQLRKAQENELSKSHQLTRQVSTFSQTENELRGQLNVYVEKFKQVEDTLNNSNDLFLTFRKEMEEMSKKTKRLEKENLTLTRKQEATNKNIFAMAEERERNAKHMDRVQKENEKLKRLCRAMQEGGYGGKPPPAGAGGGPVGGAGGGGVPMPGGHHGGEQGDPNHHLGETESEYDEDEDSEDPETYDEDEEDDEDVDDEEEVSYDEEDTEEDEPDRFPLVGGQRAFGPPPPPPPPPLDDRDKPAYVLGGQPNGRARGPVPLANGHPPPSHASGQSARGTAEQRSNGRR